MFVSVALTTEAYPQQDAPPGRLIDIGGQLLHLNCSGSGTPTVLLESGVGDLSTIWSTVQTGVGRFTRVCSYDRGGYVWSQPGQKPRTFDQLALELHTALTRAGIAPPYLLVGQSYGGLVVRGYFRNYAGEVHGMVLVDAVHEDQRTVYGGQAHRIRESARGRPFPAPRIALDTATLTRFKDSLPTMISAAQDAEMDWSPEELARFHNEREKHRATLGKLPLIVLARTDGGYPSGMDASPEELEQERRRLQADLAALSTRGRLRYAAHAGHNVHVEDPELVISAIREVVEAVRRE